MKNHFKKNGRKIDRKSGQAVKNTVFEMYLLVIFYDRLKHIIHTILHITIGWDHLFTDLIKLNKKFETYMQKVVCYQVKRYSHIWSPTLFLHTCPFLDIPPKS